MDWQKFATLYTKTDAEIQDILYQEGLGDAQIPPLFWSGPLMAPNGKVYVIKEGRLDNVPLLEEFHEPPSAIETVKQESIQMDNLIKLLAALRTENITNCRNALAQTFQLWARGSRELILNGFAPEELTAYASESLSSDCHAAFELDEDSLYALAAHTANSIMNDIMQRIPARITIPEMKTLFIKDSRLLRASTSELDQLQDIAPLARFGYITIDATDQHSQINLRATINPLHQVWQDFILHAANAKSIGFCVQCKKPFVGSQPNKTSCDSICSNAYAQLQYRRRKGQGEKRGRPSKL